VGAIGLWGWYHLVFFGLLLPVIALRSRRKLAQVASIPRKQFFISVLVQQGIFVTVSLVVARFEAVPLFPRLFPTPQAWTLGALLLAVSWVAMRPLWRDAVVRRDPRVHLSMPSDREERGLWLAISVAAGIGEEISYRGVMYTLLFRLMGEPVGAAVAAALLFGAAHVVQGWRGIGVTTVFAVAAQALVLWSGTLYVAIAWHVAYDIVAGLSYGRYGRELGYPACVCLTNLPAAHTRGTRISRRGSPAPRSSRPAPAAG
jgi:membrane protease YdiL (CAAX protease family)